MEVWQVFWFLVLEKVFVSEKRQFFCFVFLVLNSVRARASRRRAEGKKVEHEKAVEEESRATEEEGGEGGF